MMLKAYKYRIYPNKDQEIALSQSFGSCRYIYNKGLAYKIEKYKNDKESVSYNKLNSLLKELKQDIDWLRLPPSQSLQQSLRNLDTAYKNFFRRNKKGLSKGFPKFKRKFDKQTLSLPQGVSLDFKDSKIILPKIGRVFAVLHRKFKGKIKTCVVSKTKSNKYFCSVLVENDENIPTKTPIEFITDKDVIALDVGISHFLTDSKGNKVENPKFYHRSLEKLKRLQRKLSKLKKRSENYSKMKLRIAKLHEYISNCRKDFLHKLSSNIVNDNQVIIVEDLNVENMKTDTYKSLARNISDVSWSEFFRMLEYKSLWRGKYYIKVNPRNTSKKCSICGKINKNLKLSDREWQCSHCHSKHDRDFNASINILKLGFKKLGQELPEFQNALNENVYSFSIGSSSL